MKKSKQESPVKAARKAIEKRLINELKAITGQLVQEGIKTTIDIEKQSKKLAKKITKGLKLKQSAKQETVKENAVASATKTPVREKESAPVKAVPAAKAPEAKDKKAPAPAATANTAPKAKASKPAPQKQEAEK
jgi:hypothetical protein